MMNNLANLVQTLRIANNPMKALEQMGNNNPLASKAFQMVQGKNDQEIMQVAENLAKEQGKDINQIKQEIITQLRSMGFM